MKIFWIIFINIISISITQQDIVQTLQRLALGTIVEPADYAELNFINSTSEEILQMLSWLRRIEYVNSRMGTKNRGKAPWVKLNDGNKMPAFGFGSGGVTNFNEFENELVEAISSGYRLFDTSEIYFSEFSIGKAIRRKMWDLTVRREDVYIVTKLWNNHHKREFVVPALLRSLTRLGLSYVDLYLIHWPMDIHLNGIAGDTDYLETWKGMEECKERGLAKSIGLSNFNISQIQRILNNSVIKPVVLEIEVNPHVTARNITKFCQEKGIKVICYSPLGFLTKTQNDQNSPPPTPTPKLDDPILTNIANRYNKTTVQVVLRYLVDRKLIPIPKSSSAKRISQNIDIFDFHLTPEEIHSIDSFNSNQRIFSKTEHKSHRYYPF